jgi:hypothetical protein
VNLALGVLFLWVGAGCLHLASHGIQASSPWEAYQTLLTKIREA